MINNIKSINTLIIIFALFSIKISSQTIQWQNTIGGSNYEWLYTTELASDGDYILGGYSYSNISGDKNENSRGENDFWITKIDDNSGNILWQKTIGGSLSDHATSTKETSDGGYILGGYSNSNISGEKTENSRGGDDYWVVRLDSDRNIVWDKTYGGTGVDRLWSIIETDDGGFLMGGESDSNISGDKDEDSRGLNDMWILKIDSNGIIEWQKTYGGNDRDFVKSIVNTDDGGYILASSSMSDISGEKTENSRGISDYWILKIDALGSIIWQRTLGGDNGDSVKFIQSTSDGDFIIGGDSSSSISGEKTENSICNSVDIWLIKLDNNGQIVWDRTLGGDSTEWLGNIRETDDNGFVIGAMSYSDISGYKTEPSNGDRDYWIVKLDEFGNVEWDKTLGGSDTDQLTSIVQANDGSYVFGGWSLSNISGDKTENTNGLWDYWIIKLTMNSSDYSPQSYSSITICEDDDLELNATSGTFYAWSGPNGFSSTEQNPIITNASLLNSGIYNVTISNNTSCIEIQIINVSVGTSTLLIDTVDNMYECDYDSDGFAFFNLEQLKSDIVGTLTNINISFYRENGQLIPDSELPAVENMIINEESITVKAVNSDSSCSSEAEFKLIVSPLPIINNLNNLFSCDEGSSFASFDTTTIENEIIGIQTGLEVLYFNQNGDELPSPLPNPLQNTISGQETISARVYFVGNSICFTEVSFDLIVEVLPEVFDVNDIYKCDDNNDGFANFDLRNIESIALGGQTGMLVEFYDGNGDQLPNPLPNPFINTIPNQETITVRVINETTDCYNETTFILKVNALPVANPLDTLIGCDDNNDGISEYFDTTNIESLVLGSQIGMLVSYFDVLGNSLPNPLPNPFTNTEPNSQDIIVRVTNSSTDCYSETILTLETATQPNINQPENLFACDEGNGFAYFDTSGIEDTLIGSQVGLEVFYFDDSGNALPSPLPNSFSNTIPFSQIINVRVENILNSLCYSETSFNLIINDLPEISLDEEYFICNLEPFIALSVNPDFSAYEWYYEDGSLISSTYTAEIESEGSYSLTVSQIENGITCGNSYTFSLVRSVLPEIQQVNYGELGNNFIEIIVSGDGDFEYSIDGVNFQDSNYFANIQGGTYIAYVRDKDGCGEDTDVVTVIDFPNFFTPNNDEVNDYWQVKGIDEYFGSKIFIFDRFGKILKEFSPNDIGWDGTYNGKEMPSSDYWFKVDLGNKTFFHGHFTLKR